MNATHKLYDAGQSIWIDNITRSLLGSGTLNHYIDELSVTGLTSNPTIFDHAIKNSTDYDADIRRKLGEGKSGERLFFELALDDITRAADIFRPVYERTCGVDGWVSSRFLHSSRITPRRRSQKPRSSMLERGVLIFTSRSLAPRRAFRPSKRLSSRAFLSM
jgi:hypothetical protein